MSRSHLNVLAWSMALTLTLPLWLAPSAQANTNIDVRLMGVGYSYNEIYCVANKKSKSAIKCPSVPVDAVAITLEGSRKVVGRSSSFGWDLPQGEPLRFIPIPEFMKDNSPFAGQQYKYYVPMDLRTTVSLPASKKNYQFYFKVGSLTTQLYSSARWPDLRRYGFNRSWASVTLSLG